jgi:hypothetical protein
MCGPGRSDDEKGKGVRVTTGSRFRSAVCQTEVVVVKAPQGEIELWCGGKPMLGFEDALEPTDGAPEPGQDQGSDLGKRYVREDVGLEVLCTKGGKGTLSVAGAILETQQAKPLPSSD